MLCYAFHVLRQQNYADIETEEFQHIHDMFAAIVIRGIAQQLKQGLYRTYITNIEQLNTVRGKINPLQTKQLRSRRIQRIECSFDELSENNELNQILRATVCILLHSREVTKKHKEKLKSLLLFFGDVSNIDLSFVQWNRLQIHKINRSYEMLMNICQMVWMSLLPSTAQGKTHFSLFDEESMPRLFEKFILAYYKQHYPMLNPNDNPIKWDLSETTDPSMIRMLPGMHSDIMLQYKEKTLIIDAKFYQHSLITYMGKQMLYNANLYQIFTYVKNKDKNHTGKVDGLLLYARTTEEKPPFLDAIISNNRIRVSALDLNNSFSEIARTLDRIIANTFPDSCNKIA